MKGQYSSNDRKARVSTNYNISKTSNTKRKFLKVFNNNNNNNNNNDNNNNNIVITLTYSLHNITY